MSQKERIGSCRMIVVSFSRCSWQWKVKRDSVHQVNSRNLDEGSPEHNYVYAVYTKMGASLAVVCHWRRLVMKFCAEKG